MQQTVNSGKSDPMGRGEHVDSIECYIVHQEVFGVQKKCETNRTVATSLVYLVRACSLPRSVLDLPSHGGGLERSC